MKAALAINIKCLDMWWIWAYLLINVYGCPSHNSNNVWLEKLKLNISKPITITLKVNNNVNKNARKMSWSHWVQQQALLWHPFHSLPTASNTLTSQEEHGSDTQVDELNAPRTPAYFFKSNRIKFHVEFCGEGYFFI